MEDHDYSARGSAPQNPMKKRRRSARGVAKRRPSARPANATTARETRSSRPGLLSLPYEVLLEILSYLGPQDLQSVRKVSRYLETIANDPKLWKSYEVWKNQIPTSDVIKDLKRMPHLKRIHIFDRNDCDDILRQLSLSNRHLEQLYISNCEGTPGSSFLRPSYLTRILQRCRSLHTFSVTKGTRFRGLKFYKLLAEAGPRLRWISATTTRAQLETFLTNVSGFSGTAWLF